MAELVLVADAGDGTISSLALDAATGSLAALSTTPVGPGVGTFAVDSARGLVFAAHKDDPSRGRGAGIATLTLDRASGALTEVSWREVGDSLCYVSLALGGSVLLGASYGGGFAASWPVSPTGEVGEQVARVEFANVHCVVSNDETAYVVSLGDDLVAQYRLGRDGSLTPLDPAVVKLPAGSGPRHLVLDGSSAYLVTEFSGEVFHLTAGADGALSLGGSVSIIDPEAGLSHSRIGADPRAEHLIWGADLHRCGAWLLATERTASTLAAVSVEADGTLGRVVDLAEVPAQPRGFGVTSDGGFAIVVGERSTEAALVQIGADGSLTTRASAPVGQGANWVRVV